jgi:glycine/D-amino acid oxidase-like deaminating enzyme
MVGVSVALHLQRRGRDVALIDRRGAGEETSYGNAGLIQRDAVIPYTFPLKRARRRWARSAVRRRVSSTARQPGAVSPSGHIPVFHFRRSGRVKSLG